MIVENVSLIHQQATAAPIATVDLNDNCKSSREVSVSIFPTLYIFLFFVLPIDGAVCAVQCVWVVNEIVNIGGRINHSNFSTANRWIKHSTPYIPKALWAFFYDIFIRARRCNCRWKAIKTRLSHISSFLFTLLLSSIYLYLSLMDGGWSEEFIILICWNFYWLSRELRVAAAQKVYFFRVISCDDDFFEEGRGEFFLLL